MTGIEKKLDVSPAEGPQTELYSKRKQKINFATLHGLVSGFQGTSSFRHRLQVIDALEAGPIYPVDFPSMTAIPKLYSEEEVLITNSRRYLSSFSNPFAGSPSMLSRWGVFITQDYNPFHMMRLFPYTLDEYRVLHQQAEGIYTAMPKDGGDVSYFVIAQSPDNSGKLQVVYPLDTDLTNKIMRDIGRAADTMQYYESHMVLRPAPLPSDLLKRYHI